MPAITIQSLELTDDQKELIADKFISIFSEATRVPKDRVYLFFDGYTMDNAAANVILFSRSPPRTAIGKFSQDSPE
jgi:phenylpyruvate tautomerase PptA (4-oxalocrotonate tautomerase family)